MHRPNEIVECLFSRKYEFWDAHIHVKIGIHTFILDAYFHNGMPIFTVNLGILMIYVKIGIQDAHIWGCLFSLDTVVWGGGDHSYIIYRGIN